MKNANRRNIKIKVRSGVCGSRTAVGKAQQKLARRKALIQIPSNHMMLREEHITAI